LSSILLRRPWRLIVPRPGPRLLILQARRDGRLAEGAAQQLGFRPRDLRRGTRFGGRRPLARDVREMLDLGARRPGAGGGASLLKRDLGEVQLGRSEGAHTRGAARALDRGTGVMERRRLSRAGTGSQCQRHEAGKQG
jgi:hypothetical protein